MQNTAAASSSIFATLKQVQTKQQEAPAQHPQPTVAANVTTPQATLPPIDHIHLEGAWQRFRNELPANEMYMKSLMDQTPKCHDNVVVASITDPSQASICKRDDLLHYLRKELNRRDIVIETVLDTTKQNSTSTPFTSLEKLHSMVDDNKNLQKLIELFGLQLD